MGSVLEMAPIPADHKNAGIWSGRAEFQSNGTSPAYFEATSQYGTLRFGLGSDGRVGWSWKETGGGGAVSIMFSLVPGKSVLDGLLIGFLAESRQNMGPRSQLCIVGGFKKTGEANEDANKREFEGETGGKLVTAIALDGLPFNSNRLYFEADPDAGEGVHAFAVNVQFDKLIPAADGTMEHGDWKPKGSRLVFLPWRMAAQQTADALAGLPIVRLLAQLTEAPEPSSYPGGPRKGLW